MVLNKDRMVQWRTVIRVAPCTCSGLLEVGEQGCRPCQLYMQGKYCGLHVSSGWAVLVAAGLTGCTRPRNARKKEAGTKKSK